MGVICKGGCSWFAYCAKLLNEETWQLRKIVDNHTCSREIRVKLLSSKWLSKKLHTSVRENPKIKPSDISEKVQNKWNAGISKTKAFRARSAALDLVDDSFREQYTRLYDYNNELLRSNDQMLPIAVAVVEGETKDSWIWFLELLISDLGGAGQCSTYTFINDQQKGLLPAIEELLLGMDHIFCARHLYNNFRKRHVGKKLKELMWKAAKATYPQAWEKVMKEIRTVNEEAFKYLIQIPPRFWSKSRFRVEPKCDILLNNMTRSKGATQAAITATGQGASQPTVPTTGQRTNQEAAPATTQPQVASAQPAIVPQAPAAQRGKRPRVTKVASAVATGQSSAGQAQAATQPAVGQVTIGNQAARQPKPASQPAPKRPKLQIKQNLKPWKI